MRKTFVLRGSMTVVTIMILAGSCTVQGENGHHSDRVAFKKDTLVLSRSVYVGTADTVRVQQTLPPDCVAKVVEVPVLPDFVSANGGEPNTPVTVACATATADGTYPGVFNNNKVDGSFGVTSPIFLDDITSDGKLLNTVAVNPSSIVTSFSSKSELALNRSL